jgi:hypothetical protein
MSKLDSWLPIIAVLLLGASISALTSRVHEMEVRLEALEIATKPKEAPAP